MKCKRTCVHHHFNIWILSFDKLWLRCVRGARTRKNMLKKHYRVEEKNMMRVCQRTSFMFYRCFCFFASLTAWFKRWRCFYIVFFELLVWSSVRIYCFYTAVSLYCYFLCCFQLCLLIFGSLKWTNALVWSAIAYTSFWWTTWFGSAFFIRVKYVTKRQTIEIHHMIGNWNCWRYFLQK